jgi:hypothetical protein
MKHCFNHGHEPQSKRRGIKLSASRDCSTYQFRFAFGIGVSTMKFGQKVIRRLFRTSGILASSVKDAADDLHIQFSP